MPFTRISLRQSYSDAQIEQISNILQQTLEETFSVPPNDRFQIFETLSANRHLYDRNYLSGGRSDHFIQFHLIAGRPRSFEQKKQFCRVLCKRLHRDLSVHPDDVMIIIQFNTPEDWSFSNGRLLSEEVI